jgi:hypothetical protein
MFVITENIMKRPVFQSSYMQHQTKHRVSSDGASELYLGGNLFKFLSQHWLSWQVFLGGFPQPLEVNSVMGPHIIPSSLLPYYSALDIR